MDPTARMIVRLGIVVAMSFALLMIYLLSGWKGDPYSGYAEVRLRYNPPMRYAGWFMLALAIGFPIAIIVLVIVFPPPHVGHMFGAAGFAIAVVLGGLYIWRETRIGYVSISPERILQFSPWWGTRAIEWPDVTKAELVSVGLIILTGADGKKLTFKPTYWTGIDSIIDAIRKHVSGDAIESREGAF